MSDTGTTVEQAMRIAGAWRNPPSADDAVAIGNLLQAYALYTDQGLRAELAGLFTDDASWDGTELGYSAAVGPQAIVDVVQAHFDPAKPMVHLPGPPLLVQVDANAVEAVSWTLATRLENGVTKPLIYFSYTDVLRRTGTGWLFASRVLRLTFRGA